MSGSFEINLSSLSSSEGQNGLLIALNCNGGVFLKEDCMVNGGCCWLTKLSGPLWLPSTKLWSSWDEVVVWRICVEMLGDYQSQGG